MTLDNIPAFYRGTSPNKFFDYIAAGIPVVNNYLGWLADMISDNGCGVVVKPDDPSALATALERLAANPQEASYMGIKSRTLAEKSFDRRRLAALFAESLEQWHDAAP